MAQGMERRGRIEITPCFGISLLRGQGAVDAREQQGVVLKLADAQFEPQLLLLFPELSQRLDQDIGRVTSRRPAFDFGALNRMPCTLVSSTASRTSITFRSRTTRPQRSARASPNRNPVNMATIARTNSRCPRINSMNTGTSLMIAISSSST